MKLDKCIKFNHVPNDIVIIGEILIDYIKDNDNTLKIVAGSPYNIFRNLKQSHEHISFFGSIGNDQNGKFVLEEISKDNLDNFNININDGNTTVVEINKSLNTPIPIFKRGLDYNIKFSVEMQNKISNSKIMHFSYWPLSMQESYDVIIKAISLAKENNVVVCFDPNYHKGIIGDKEVSIKDYKTILSNVDIIKPSIEDAVRLFGDAYSESEYIDLFHDLGAKVVILTLGDKGLIVSNYEEKISLPSLAEVVVDVTGAGDAFWTGLYTGLLKGYSILKSVKIGLAYSANALRTVGSKIVFPNLEDIEIEYKLRSI